MFYIFFVELIDTWWDVNTDELKTLIILMWN